MTKNAPTPEAVVAELILHLASTDRQRIFAELRESDLRLNEISKLLGMTPTETLRQVHRLTEARLLEKMTDGRYRLTSYGSLVLDSTSPLRFLFRFRDYFLEHDAFLLPAGFRRRLEELSSATYTSGTIETINVVTEIIQSAREQIDSIVLGTANLIELMRERSNDGVRVRWLMHDTFKPKAPATLRAWDHRPEVRTTPTVPGHIIYNEKAALVTIRKLDGSMSYDSFSGDDPLFRAWARDLFLHEWERARPWSA